jgi:phage terminase large subunit
MQNPIKVLCTREYQTSIKDSVKTLLDDTIASLGLSGFFESTQSEIRGVNGSLFIFQGLYRNVDSIKSLEGVDICWAEEANVITKESLDVLIPTIRNEGSEIWFSYNRKKKDEPVHAMAGRPDAVFNEINFDDNPYFPDVLRGDMEWDKAHDQGRYEHVWLGKPQVHSEAQVFNGKYKIQNFETPEDVVFYYGADWGFSVDPTVCVRLFIDADARKLYIDREAWGIGEEIQDLPEFFDTVPGVRDWPIVADSARPETIQYMKRDGFRILSAKKGKGSVEDGIEYLKSFEIIIHERCKRTADEFRLYSYKTDKLTGEVVPMLEDKNNHCIDACRYAVERARRRKKVLIN